MTMLSIPWQEVELPLQDQRLSSYRRIRTSATELPWWRWIREPGDGWKNEARCMPGSGAALQPEVDKRPRDLVRRLGLEPGRELELASATAQG